jgi:mono/diheme cytochrome c family protein
VRPLALVLLAATLALAVAGCGGGGDNGTTEASATGTSTTGGGSGDAAAGKEVFASAGCGGCHTFSAAGSTGGIGPNLDDASPSFDKVVSQVTNGGGAMPSFKNDLTLQQIQNVAAFVSGS